MGSKDLWIHRVFFAGLVKLNSHELPGTYRALIDMVLVLYAFSDLTFVLFPVIIVWRLNMPIHRRIGLVFVMALGLVTLASALLKFSIIIITTFGGPVESGGTNYYQGLVYLTSSIEQALVIIMGCIPTLQQAKGIPFSRIKSISSSLASFIPKLRRRGSSSEASTQYNSPSYMGYQDLELRPHLKISGDSVDRLEVPIVAATEVSSVGQSMTHMEEHAIRRTDNYNVTYYEQGKPKEAL